MIKYILFCISIISVIYGILILQVGSGTKFWLIWEAIGGLFFLWAVLVQKDFFAVHAKAGRIFHALVIIASIVLVTFCGMIVGEFNAKGKANLDYIIVLGAQVRENGPSVVLRYRLDEAITYLSENSDTICIVSGGQGANEPCSEAEGMAKYLLEKGIDEKRILLEDQSRNTVQNIQNSQKLLEHPDNSVGIVTNNFHLFRAMHIAETQHIENVYGISAYSKPLYLPNNILRECFGILKDWMVGNISI